MIIPIPAVGCLISWNASPKILTTVRKIYDTYPKVKSLNTAYMLADAVIPKKRMLKCKASAVNMVSSCCSNGMQKIM